MLKRISSLLTSLVLSLSYLLAFVPTPVHAVADACTWTGGGADANFSTTGNWNCATDGAAAVPEDGLDSLIFDASAVDFDAKAPVNDMTDATFTGITFVEDSTNYDTVDITGTDFSLSGDIVATDPGLTISSNITLTSDVDFSNVTIDGSLDLGSNTLTASDNITLSGVVSGSGNLVFNDYATISGANTFTGNVTVGSTGYVTSCNIQGLGTAAGTTTVQDGGYLSLAIADKGSLDEPISITGEGINGYALNIFSICAGGSGSGGFDISNELTHEYGGHTATLSAVTLNGETKTRVHYKDTLKLTGATLNANEISLTDDSKGTLVVNGTTKTYVKKKTTIDKNTENTDGHTLYPGEEITVNGKTGNISLFEGSTLKGSGTVGTVLAYPLSTVAAGNSPGCLKTDDINLSGATLEVEVAGADACTGYDQMQVTGAVYLFDAVLELSFPDEDYLPTAGTKFVIISNDDTDGVNGTFLNLEEGATFESNGGVFSVSYEGGDGNDVEITVVSTPTAPDTGFALVGNSPLLTLIATTSLAGLILGLRRQYAKVAVK